MFKNSQGNPDFLMTASVLALAVVLIRALASGVVVSGVTLGILDPGMVAALLAPTLTAYTVKRVGLAMADAQGGEK
jgi:hypothetical protein